MFFLQVAQTQRTESWVKESMTTLTRGMELDNQTKQTPEEKSQTEYSPEKK